MNKTAMSRREIVLLGVLVTYTVAAYLPWSHEATVARVSVFAWMLFALMVAAPLAGLLVALSAKDGD